jgi:hypothetical protein
MSPKFLSKGALRESVSNAAGAGFLFATLAALGSAPAAATPITFSVGGDATTASIQATVDAFRAALGDPNNANNPGPLASGRREINWDGGGNPANSPGGTPFNVFLNTRGGQFITPGTGFVQAPPSGGPDNGLAGFFANPTYGDDFGVFSAPRNFTPVGSNVTEGLFFVPGTAGSTRATVTGFGAVFTDVDLADSAKIEFFDRSGGLLTEEFVPAGSVTDKSLSFLGVVFDAGEEIFRVRITTGTDPLATGTNDNPAAGVDLVVMDDFLYAEPQSIPEPASWTLLAVSALTLFGLRRGRKRNREMAPAP